MADFLSTTPESADLNQYWYSGASIETLVAEAVDVDGPVAFLSTPSLYFTVPAAVRRDRNFKLLDFDAKFVSDPGFAAYDFRDPLRLDPSLLSAFAGVVIDPPFITEEVWRKYGESVRALLKPGGGRVLATTIAENAPLMLELFGCTPQRWLPSIPNLVYQYSCYANYKSARLELPNPEVPE
jgi:EEF1A lysine methyltransferase 1